MEFAIEEIMSKLGIKDKRSIGSIFGNKELCARIMKENPQRLTDYLPKSAIPRPVLTELIAADIISSFCNSGERGSPVFIFTNEIDAYQPQGGLKYNNASFWDYVKRQNKLFISFVINAQVLAPRELDCFAKINEFRYDLFTLSAEYGITTVRMKEILETAHNRLLKSRFRIKDVREMTIEIQQLQREISYLKDVKNRMTKRDQKNKKVVFIEDLNFTVRTYNCLKSKKIDDLHTLLEHSENELLKIEAFGNKSLQEVKSELRTMGLKLKEA